VSNVLLVEADAIVRNLVIRVLSQQGFKIYEAATAEEALTLCESLADESLDLLIADHATTGRDVAESILAACANTKMIQISGSPFETVQKEQALLPGSSFLQKPFTPMELVLAVQTALNPRTQ